MLVAIKKDPALRRIPVVVITTSEAPRDVLDAYSRRANFYMSKPMDLDHFLNAVQALLAVFTRVASLSHL